jgi:hypothetical protein
LFWISQEFKKNATKTSFGDGIVPKRDEDGGFTGVVCCWPAEAAARAVANENDEEGWLCCWMAGVWGCC